MFSEARCPGSRRRCAAETQHCSCRAAVGPRPQQLWSARRSPSVSAAALELPLLGSNQDSPDPERIRAKSIFRQRVSSPRVRVVRCREERPKNRTLTDLTDTETMAVSPQKMASRSALGSGEPGLEQEYVDTQTETMTLLSR